MSSPEDNASWSFPCTVAGVTFTNECNQHCAHCHNNSRRSPATDELLLNQWVDVAMRLASIGVEFVSFGGGESFVRPDFLEFVAALRSIGMRTGVITNGFCLDLGGVDWQLFETVSVSVDYADPDLNDKWRHCSGAFDEALRTIRHLVSIGVEVEVFTTLTRDTVVGDNLARIRRILVEEGVSYWKLNRYRAIGRGPASGSWGLSPQEFFNVVQWVSQGSNGLVITDPLIAALCPKLPAIHACSCGSSSIRVGANGDLSPCTFLGNMVLGNALCDDLPAIWKSHPLLHEIRSRSPVGKCKGCVVWDTCRGGCYASAYLEHSVFGAPDPQCWHNPETQASASARQLPVEGGTTMRSYSCNLYVDLHPQPRVPIDGR